MKIIKAENADWTLADGYRKKIFFGENDLAQKGALAQIVVVDPGHEVKPHYHQKTYEAIYVVEGMAKFTINDTVHETAPGDIILTEPNDVHSVNNNSDKPWKVFVFKTNNVPDDSIWLDG